MEFRLSAEQELFKQTLREYCEKNIEPLSREIDEKEEGIPDDILHSHVCCEPGSIVYIGCFPVG